MRVDKDFVKVVAALPLLLWLCSVQAGEWSGHVALETRLFNQSPPDSRQDEANLSISFLPEFYHSWNDGNDSLVFEPFVRIDSDDNERTHADIRELMWVHVGDSGGWETHVGIGKVFWGVTESQHLVDIINQTDLIENLDGEDKLGQPMAKLSLVRDWGIVDLFLLPYFRERTFPGTAGRIRSLPHVETDLAFYESGREQHHLDWAARWSHSIDIWDIGVSHFSGTSRDPTLVPVLHRGEVVLAPFYEQIDQTGLDVQATIDEWLLKLELIHRDGQGESYHAMTSGFEYTFVGVNESAHDVGVLMEYLHDSRGQNTPGLFEDDLFMGARWVWNDAEDTQLLFGIIQDTSSSERLMRLEGSRRIGESLKLSLEAQIYANISEQSPLYHFNREDFIQLELAWYF